MKKKPQKTAKKPSGKPKEAVLSQVANLLWEDYKQRLLERVKEEIKAKKIYFGATLKCLDCGDVIKSKHVHDYVACSCYAKPRSKTGVFIDGGGEYLRMGYKDKTRYEVVSEGNYKHT